jgi:hypothetical protein
VQTESGSSDDGTDLATSNFHRNSKTETMYSDSVQNDSAANINTNTTALQIIIDFPSYVTSRKVMGLIPDEVIGFFN